MKTAKNLIQLYKQESAQVFNSIADDDIENLVDVVWDSYQRGSTIFACGNGGNAGFVANLIQDLICNPFVTEDKSESLNLKKRLIAIDLCASPAMITGLMNDLGPDSVFSGQVEVYAKKGDVIIGFSGSGGSKNILEAFVAGRERETVNVLITRNPDGKCATHCDLVIEIPGNSTFPGQTGKNNNNFHYEDCLAKLSHVVTGILKGKIQDELKSQ